MDGGWGWGTDDVVMQSTSLPVASHILLVGVLERQGRLVYPSTRRRVYQVLDKGVSEYERKGVSKY